MLGSVRGAQAGRTRVAIPLAAVIILGTAVALARAQFRPIPNYVGIGAGQQFRNDINNHLSGATPIAPRLVSIPFAQLPAEQDGQIYWCPDCKQQSTCAGGGSGTLALGAAGAWTCATGPTMANGFPLTVNVSAANHQIQGLAADSSTGDALSRGQSTLNSLAAPTAAYAMAGQKLQGLAAGSIAGDALAWGQSGAQLNGLNFSGSQASGLAAASASGQAIAFAQNGAQLTTNNPAIGVVSWSLPLWSSSPQVVPAPSGIVAGNALVLAIDAPGSPTFTLPSGFNVIRTDGTSAGETQQFACKTATGSEPGSYSISFTGGGTGSAAIIQLSNTNCAHLDTSAGGAEAGSTNYTIPTLTTTQGDEFVLVPGGCANNNATPVINTGVYNAVNGGNSNALAVAGYTQYAQGTTRAPGLSCNNATGLAGAQVAFIPTSTLQSAPIVSSQSGAQLASLTSSVNGVINVQAAPYNAQADGNTDDEPAIQNAIYAAEGATPPTFPTAPYGGFQTVYLPASSTAGKCYAISKPLRVASGPIEIRGDGGTCIAKLYAGPTIINEGWGIDSLQHGPALIGSGQSLSTVGCTNSGCPSNHGILDLAQFLNTTQRNLGTDAAAGGFDIEFWMEPTSLTGGGIFSSNPNNPGSGSGMFSIGQNGSGGVYASVNTTGGLVSLTACPNQSTATAYDIALDWDKSTYRLFQGGTLCSSVSSSNAPVLGTFESMQLPAEGGFDYWMAGGLQAAPFQGYIDSVDIEYGSKHTSNYTPPTTRFAPDGNTELLLNWDSSLDGTQLGYTSNGSPVYLPVLVGGSPSITTSMHLHNMELCTNDGNANHRGDGLFSQWSVGSEIDHVRCSNAVFAGLDFYNNDYGTVEHDNIVNGGKVGILHGVAWNGAYSYNDDMDSNAIACEMMIGDGGGNFHESHQFCTNRGTLHYCFMYMSPGFASQADYTNCDQEAGDSNYVAGLLLYSPGIPIQFNAPDVTGVSGHPFIEQDGGGVGPTLINPQFQQGSGSTYLINYGSAPSSPAILINPSNPFNVPLSNNLAYVETIGVNSILGALELQTVPKLDAGMNHVAVNAIANPAAPTISVVGATGSTAYGPYFVVCHDVNGGVTMASPSSNTVANGPAVLSGSNHIQVTWTGLANCASWDVLKNSTASSIATGLAAGATSFNDTGSATAAYTAPARNTTGDLSYGSELISNGTTFANLPSLPTNGARIYCSDCDPPANPPAACTHSGAKTGAFADGINGTWLCAP